MNNLIEVLTRAPPEAESMRYGSAKVSFEQLLSGAMSLASGLKSLGVKKGDRVALWLPNIPAWFESFFACAQLGAIAVSVNTRFRSHELADIISRSQAKVMILWPDFKGLDFAEILDAVPDQNLAALEHFVVYQESHSKAPASMRGIATTSYLKLLSQPPLSEIAGTLEDRCVIFTTSGTTKAPKFVCHAQRSVLEHSIDVIQAFELDAADVRLLQALPMCGVFGFTQALAALAAARPMDILPIFDAKLAAEIVRGRLVTHTNAVDEMIAAMLDCVDDDIAFPSLRVCGYVNFKPALENIIDRASQRGLGLSGLYGMSECHALYALQPGELAIEERRKGGGRPVSPRAMVRVRAPETGKLLAPGEHGELEISGPSLMMEYFENPEATGEAFTADGFLRTGDLGYLETDGRFCFLSRLGDVLRLSGFLTSPAEIESVLNEHSTIRASQVVAIDINGRSVAVAFVIPSIDAPDLGAVTVHCEQRLAAYKVPGRIYLLQSFPTTPGANGTKIQKKRLRELALAALEDETNATEGS